jgi:integral membrane sensor domain MASE1
MTEVWLSPGTWTHEQWLVFSILGFVILAVVAVAYRLSRLLRSVNTKRELPNLRPGRRPRR